MKYRSDIQLLRGVAVLAVVGYHLHIPGFQSGFLGVDVFFTISGYLMAVLYTPGEARDFLKRRALRILPAYYFTVLVTLLVAAAITVPSDFRQVVEQSYCASVLASNVCFWYANSYFEQTQFSVLLHLWSLGVEIQFYVLVPVVAWSASRLRWALPALFVLSLAACLVVTGVSPKTSFFMMPLRLWEFVAGFVVARHLSNRGAVNLSNMAVTGFCALAVLVVLVVMSTDTHSTSVLAGHPGLRAIVACLCTAVVLAVGVQDGVSKSAAGHALALVGKYSYSIYLVHFPLIMLYLYHPFETMSLSDITVAQVTILLVLTTSAALILFHVIEAPAREARRLASSLWWMPAFVMAIGAASIVVERLAYSRAELMIFDAMDDRATYRCGKVFRLIHPTAASCELTEARGASEALSFLLVGNSHADSIKEAFAAEARLAHVRVWFLVENQPMMAGGMTPARVVKEAIDRHADTIVLHYSPNSIESTTLQQLVEVAAAAGRQVAIIMPVPVWSRSVPEQLYRHLRYGLPLPVQRLVDYRASNAGLSEAIGRITAPNFSVYATGSIFCDDECRMSAADGKPWYFDGGHLTLTGAEQLRPLIANLIRERMVARK